MDFLQSIFILSFLWNDYGNDETHYIKYYQYMMRVLYAIYFEEKPINILYWQYVKNKNGSPIFNIAASCEFYSIYFTIAHEVAHSYIDTQNYNINQYDQEVLADSIALDIIYDLFIDERKMVVIENRELLDYCFLAPMMFCDILDLYYFFSFLNGKAVKNDGIHPLPQIRKEMLFERWKKYDFSFLDVVTREDTEIIYSCFKRTIDTCKNEMLLKKEDGSFEKLIKWIEENNNGNRR